MTCRNSTEATNDQECQPPAHRAAYNDTSEKADETFSPEGLEEKQFHGNVGQNPKYDSHNERPGRLGGKKACAARASKFAAELPPRNGGFAIRTQGIHLRNLTFAVTSARRSCVRLVHCAVRFHFG